MVYELQIGSTNFVVHVHKRGGRTDVYKNKQKYFSGQYVPTRKRLYCAFKFSEIVKKIEASINKRIGPQDVIFPYYGK